MTRFGFSPSGVLHTLVLLAAAMGASAIVRAQGTDNPHGALTESCSTCHRPDAWKPARVLPQFKHAARTFPLNGAHLRTSCTSCHKSLVFAGTPAGCASCHSDVHVGELGTECARCHTTRSFTDMASMRRTHDLTRFPLRGAHAAVLCETCHLPSQPGKLQFVGQPVTCIGCHATTFRLVKAPDHIAARFSQDCTSCHGVSSWVGAKFDHSTTRFALSGSHRAVSCSGCHADKVYSGKPTACASCHQARYAATVNPPHAAAGFPTTCEGCHNTSTWPGATFNHAGTQFPLTGAHVAALCSACHGDGVFKGKSTVCVSCHQQDYNASKLPPHQSLGFSTTCAACHTTARWPGGAYDHSTTQFPLTGAHNSVACASCHADNVYRGKPTTCVSCHQKDFTGALLPPHQSLGFSSVCSTCHTTTTWVGGTYDHSTVPFPLTGAHRAVACASCHGDNVYRGKSMLCVSCHQAKYNATTNPPHGAAGFPTSCEACHSTTAWTGSSFNHAATTFPLTGAHVTALCTACHGDGVYKGKSTSCVSCHQQSYNTAALPPHQSLGFSTVCSVCHTTTRWPGGTYDHSTTQFPLSGAHLALTCKDCHADGVYRGKPKLCVSCHQAKYTATTSPPHAAAGFPTTCETCHSTKVWTDAVFSHSSTRYPLTGAHLTVPCSSCHGDGVFRGKTMTCSGCHLARYNATTTPSHSAAGFPTTCETCHTTATWLGATFNHDVTFFPIYSGAHQGKWSTCAGCHPSPTDFRVFTCTSCHGKTQTDASHSGRAGYVYNSSNCYACHPKGRAG